MVAGKSMESVNRSGLASYYFGQAPGGRQHHGLTGLWTGRRYARGDLSRNIGQRNMSYRVIYQPVMLVGQNRLSRSIVENHQTPRRSGEHLVLCGIVPDEIDLANSFVFQPGDSFVCLGCYGVNPSIEIPDPQPAPAIKREAGYVA